MNILIVEDEKLAVDKLRQLLGAVRPDAAVIAVRDSIASAVSWLRENADAPDLVLMDIELADGQSFAIFDQVAIKCPVIFVTSYDEYALKAFKVNSIDYLLKPIQRNDLQLAFEKFDHMREVFGDRERSQQNLQHLLKELKRQAGNEYRKRFLVKHLQKLIPIDISDIALFFYEDRTTFLKTLDGSGYALDYSLDEIEIMVHPDEFFRINRGMLVSARSIREVDPYLGNRLELKLIPPCKDAIVSREKVGDFKAWLGK